MGTPPPALPQTGDLGTERRLTRLETLVQSGFAANERAIEELRGDLTRVIGHLQDANKCTNIRVDELEAMVADMQPTVSIFKRALNIVEGILITLLVAALIMLVVTAIANGQIPLP
jgi:hypothetical protein